MCSLKGPPILDSSNIYRVGLILTEQCNIACRHCWFSSSPDKRARMSLEEALGYIDQACEISSIEWISITGGEPFLFPEMVKKIILYASEKGFHTECVTNCFWASSKEIAIETLQGFKYAGLEVINISTDDFHQEYLPFEYVKNCYWASQTLGLKPVIMCTVGRSSSLDLDQVVGLLGDKGIQILGSGFHCKKPITALAIQSGFLPVGRGESIPKEELMVADHLLLGGCDKVLRDVSISSNGLVFPCCSAGGLVKGVEIGNARLNSLLDMIGKASSNLMFNVLLTEGPEGLRRRNAIPYRKNGYVNKCHLCYEVLRDMMDRIIKTRRPINNCEKLTPQADFEQLDGRIVNQIKYYPRKKLSGYSDG